MVEIGDEAIERHTGYKKNFAAVLVGEIVDRWQCNRPISGRVYVETYATKNHLRCRLSAIRI